MKEFLIGVVLVGLIVTAVYGVGNVASRIDCHRFGSASGYEVKYVNWTGCFAKQANDKWLPTDKLRGDSD